MRKVKQIGAVEFLYSMWVDEFDNPNTVLGKMSMSVAGTHIVNQSAIQTPYITLNSREHGWLSQQNMDDLKAYYDQLDTSFLITYDDDSTDTVRFAHEKGISFTPTHEGSCYYYATINLAKVL